MKNKIVKWWKQSCQRIGEHSIQVNILMIMALMIFSFYPYYDYHSWKGGNDIIPRIYIQFCGFYLMYFLTDICGVTSRIIQEIASLFAAILFDHFITLEFDFGYLQSIYWVYIIIGLIAISYIVSLYILEKNKKKYKIIEESTNDIQELKKISKIQKKLVIIYILSGISMIGLFSFIYIKHF